ncbi:hypothetical protein B0F87_104229 [Methylobacter tundripaludum]|uniref:Uncharacterized protein n=1 Tax=Methylobacter tundripaludum TaxID=173365 RepID=A0A2S6HF93_9GAMM|nr:hypothetical protein B0F87_104229 [Methylobacter tundripaludum]
MPIVMLKYLRNSESYVHENGFIATGVQALLALAGEACTPAISKRLGRPFDLVPTQRVGTTSIPPVGAHGTPYAKS